MENMTTTTNIETVSTVTICGRTFTTNSLNFGSVKYLEDEHHAFEVINALGYEEDETTPTDSFDDISEFLRRNKLESFLVVSNIVPPALVSMIPSSLFVPHFLEIEALLEFRGTPEESHLTLVCSTSLEALIRYLSSTPKDKLPNWVNTTSPNGKHQIMYSLPIKDALSVLRKTDMEILSLFNDAMRFITGVR